MDEFEDDISETYQIYDKRPSHWDNGRDHNTQIHSSSSQRSGENLDTLNPHDEPADIAGKLGEDGENDDCKTEALVPGQEADDCKSKGGDGHATKVNPASSESVNQELPNEDGGQLGEWKQAEVDEHISGKIFYVHRAGNVEVVVDTPDGGKGKSHPEETGSPDKSGQCCPLCARRLPHWHQLPQTFLQVWQLLVFVDASHVGDDGSGFSMSTLAREEGVFWYLS